jgi:hypothetical protein
MHAAPPVRVMLSRSLGWIAVQALCAGAAATNLAAWALIQAEQPAAGAWGLGLLAAALGARWAWAGQRPGELAWDGTQWGWAERQGAVQVALDLDGWMLLRFDPATGRRCWIAASRRSSAGAWSALRTALHSARPADPPDLQQP